MLTTKKIQDEIDALMARNSKSHLRETKEYKADARRVHFLRECLFYLEQKPREEFVVKQLDTLKKKLERIENGFQDWRNWQQTTKEKPSNRWLSEYNAFMGKSAIQNQIRNLEFILS